jgi:hypothetical protein
LSPPACAAQLDPQTREAVSAYINR